MKRKRPRFIVWFTCLFLSATVVIVIFLPNILSFYLGERLLTNGINHRIEGRVEVKELSLSWFGPQRGRDVTLYDPQGVLVGTVSEVNCHRSLFALLWSPSEVGRVELIDPFLTVTIDETGLSNVGRAVTPKQRNSLTPNTLEERRQWRANFFGTFAVVNGSAQVSVGKQPSTLLTGVDSELVWPKAPGFALQFTGNTGSGASFGNVQLNAQLDSAFNLQAQFHNFPSVGLDGLASLFSKRWARLPSIFLGPLADGTLHLVVDPETLEIHSDLESSHASLEIAMSLDEAGHLGQEKAGHLRLKLPPKAIQALLRTLSGDSQITTSDALTFEAKVDTFAGKIERGRKPTLSNIRFSATAQLAPFALHHPTHGSLVLHGSDFKLKLESAQSPLHVRSHVVTSQGAKGTPEGGLNADLHMGNLISRRGSLQPAAVTLNGTVQGKNLPLEWVGLLSGIGDTLKELVGPSLNFDAHIDYAKQRGSLTLAARSEQLELQRSEFVLDKGVQLKTPTMLRYRLTPSAWRLLLGKETALRLNEAAPVQVDLSELALPPNFLRRTEAPKAGRLAARLSAHSLALETSNGKRLFTLSGSEAEITGERLSEMKVQAISVLKLDDKESWLARIAGLENPLEVGAVISWDQKKALQVDRFLLRTKGPNFLADFQGQYINGVLAIIAPVEAHYRPSPEIFPQLHLQEAAHVSLVIQPFVFQASPLKLDIGGIFSTPKVAFAGAQQPTAHNLSGTFSLSIPNNEASIAVEFDAIDRTQQKAGHAELRFTATDIVQDGALALTSAPWTTLVGAHEIPTSLIAPFTGEEALGELIGNELTGEVQGSFHGLQQLQGSVNIAAKSSRAELHAALDLADTITLSPIDRPSWAYWTITPHSFHLLHERLLQGKLEDAGLTLEKPADLAVRVHQLSWPRRGALVDPKKVRLELEAQAPNASFESGVVEGLRLALQVEDLTSPSLLHLEGRVATNATPVGSGHFLLEGTVDRFLDEKGSFSLSELGSDLSLQLDQMPVRWLAQVAGLSQKRSFGLEAVLGPVLDLHAATRLDRLQGPVTLQMQSPLAQLHVDAMVEDGAVLLRKSAIARLAVTPAAGRVFLEGVNPLLASSLRSEQPVTLTIHPDGFRMPIPVKIEGMQIKQGVISPGRIWIANQGPVKTLLDFFGASSRIHASREILAWCTPLYFSLQNGIAAYARMDILLDGELQVASWGSVNLNNEELRLTFAIPGFSLKELLKIPGLPNQYYLLIPIKGTIQKPFINENKVSARIAAILAKRQGIQGAILGSMLDILSGSKSDMRKVPPPTTQPFPWAKAP